jgi:hypothetical protein
VDVAVTIETTLTDEPVPAARGPSSETVLEAVRSVVVSIRGMTTLTQTGRLAYKKVFMVAPMGLVTGSAIFRNRWMFECKGSSFFRMTFVTKVRGRIGLYHLGAKPAVGCVAVGTLNLTLPDRMVCLPVQLASHILVTCQTQIGLSCFEIMDGAVVDSVAVNAGDIVLFVGPYIEEGDFF